MPSIRILHFPLERNEAGIFRVILPSWLLNNEPPGKPDPTDLGLVEKLPLKLIREHPPLEFDNSTMLMESFQKAISGDSFEAMLPHMAPSKDPASVLDQAALLWRDFRSRKSETPLLLDVHQQGDDACALFSLFDARNPSIRKTLIQPVFSHRKNGTWALSTAADEPTAQTHPELMAWVEKASELNETEWLSQLGLTEFIEDIPADSAPTEEDARTAAEAWLSAIHSGDPRAILRTVAGFDDHRGSRKLLRAIGYELQVDRKTEILKIHRNGRWAAASTRTITTPPSDDAYLLLYPIVSTPDGPRILAEASLFHANTRSREFLNSAIWSRLSDRLSETATEELKQIEKAHAALAEAP